MKKIIITIAIAASISLGFTLIEKAENKTEVTPVETGNSSDFKNSDVIVKQDAKGMASWD
ncbi:MAG: hypothetical protein ACYCZO_08665 [Daejeonella sp.]